MSVLNESISSQGSKGNNPLLNLSKKSLTSSNKGSKQASKSNLHGSVNSAKVLSKGSKSKSQENKTKSSTKILDIHDGQISEVEIRQVDLTEPISKMDTLQEDLRTGSIKTSNSQNINSIIELVNQELPNLTQDIRYTKLYLQKQGINNISL